MLDVSWSMPLGGAAEAACACACASVPRKCSQVTCASNLNTAVLLVLGVLAFLVHEEAAAAAARADAKADDDADDYPLQHGDGQERVWGTATATQSKINGLACTPQVNGGHGRAAPWCIVPPLPPVRAA